MDILIIEKDIATAELICDYLKMNGFNYDHATDGKNGISLARKRSYALILTEVSLPDTDGFSLCKELRSFCDIPIIFVSSRTDESDIIRGLGLGADDYVKKPFSPSELIARIKTHIARYDFLVAKTPEKKSNLLISRGLKIDRLSRRVYMDNIEISLPAREYELLLFLAENPNIVFSKEHLFDRIWGIDSMGDTSTVTVHIQRIRNRLSEANNRDTYIETVRGAGYRFTV